MGTIGTISVLLIDDIAFQKKQIHSGWWGLSRETSVCYIYDMIIFPVGFSFVLSPSNTTLHCKKLKCDIVY